MTAETTPRSRSSGNDDRTAGTVLAAATVTTGLVAGLYFAWAVVVMPGLGGLDDRAFVDAAQRLDDAIRNPLFFGLFIGAFALSGVAVYLERNLGLRQVVPWIVGALVLYGLGTLITMAIHEPLNMDLVDAGDPSRITDLAGVRDAFEDEWVAWHIVRTVLTVAALVSLAYALVLHGRVGREPAQRAADASEADERRRSAAADIPAR